MLSFYIEETPKVMDNPERFILWMEKDGKKFFIDDAWYYVSEADDARFQKKWRNFTVLVAYIMVQKMTL